MRTLASYRKPSMSASQRAAYLAIALAAIGLWFTPTVRADETPAASASSEKSDDTDKGDALDQALKTKPAEAEAEEEDYETRRQREKEARKVAHLPPPKNGTLLAKNGRAWIDRDKNVVYVDGRISLRKGQLEMFACPPNTKEHESIVSVESEAFVLHAGLLAVGAEIGSPVEFAPKYKPPTGTKINIEVIWKDKEGKQHKARAQDWIRDARTKKPMELPWVFAGSGFWKNEELGTSGYLADDGDLVCVANFSTAMLDVPAKLTSDNTGLLYEAWTEKIPPLGWPVRLAFKPVLEDDEAEKTESDKPEAE